MQSTEGRESGWNPYLRVKVQNISNDKQSKTVSRTDVCSSVVFKKVVSGNSFVCILCGD